MTIVALGIASLRGVGMNIGAIAWRIRGIHEHGNQVVCSTGLGLVSCAWEVACVVRCLLPWIELTAVTLAVVLQNGISKVVSLYWSIYNP